MPCVPFEHAAEVRHRHLLAVDFVETRRPPRGIEMRDELMAEEVEVDPLVRAAALGTTEQPTVERARCGQIVNRNRKMEWGHGCVTRRLGRRGSRPCRSSVGR